MDLLGIPLGPLLASAGVAGVALGFGAQSLVKDFLSGIFMIVEDQYGVGDVIDTGEAIGTVEEVTLRITRLRDAQRRDLVRPQRRDRPDRQPARRAGRTAIVDMPVSYAENVERVIAVIRDDRHRDGRGPRLGGQVRRGAQGARRRVDRRDGDDDPHHRQVRRPARSSRVQREMRERLKAALDAAERQGAAAAARFGGPGGTGRPAGGAP